MLLLLIGLLPACSLKNFLLRLLGHRISKSASIGPVVLLGTTALTVGDKALVGAFNVVRNVPDFVVEPNAQIGMLNWFSAAPFLLDTERNPLSGRFVLGAGSSLTSRHFVDVSGGVVIGKYSTISGVRSTFMTHWIDIRANVLETASIAIGDRALVGSNCSLAPGAKVPTRSIIAMGSCVIRGLDREQALYAGTPARFKDAIGAADYWTRTEPMVFAHNDFRQVSE